MLYKAFIVFFIKFQEFTLASVFDLCFCGTLCGMRSSFTRGSRILFTCDLILSHQLILKGLKNLTCEPLEAHILSLKNEGILPGALFPKL